MAIFRHLKRMVTDWFLCGMLLATLLAYFFPGFGATGGAMHAEWVVNIGIFVVFFLHGVNLSGEQIRHGLKNTRLHLMVQVFTFGVFPLIWLASNKLLGSHVPSLLMLGFFYLCALPSTISSSVALTGSAGGNVPAAILNASLSSVLGVFLTPLLVSLVVGRGDGGIDLGSTLLDLCMMLLLPLVLGQFLRRWLAGFFGRYKRYTSIIDKLVILLLVYAAFCNSMVSGIWQQQGNGVLLSAVSGSAVLLAIILWMTTRTARTLRFNNADEIAAVFCASKKSLAAGVPMAALIFGNNPGLGLILLPIMIYHPMQLIVCSILAERYASRQRALVNRQSETLLNAR
ncbi:MULTISPECIES: bile acid:sodium symporter family protein [unclassified Pseudomonas]|uniref:bile acid:sodium symporter family protein n=1 Tax=unclassified Pseudomonas TaxID=196821 RepID=UPI00119A6325|nr:MULTISPECIES: bile acid:sodium symporter family protein [unclassified Pseudomonas]TWC10806.1 sodium/bile acid cotransporter 7 [Pseudomonas sp. SJZ075]TWC23959.1 sodium/bile acid cotransporter 7 [Pseudomonas sp. SJZ074]TWC27026.1 sodium/bile acid cotransporter 7 [Pseudomonas sp. SJZ078]TWC41698.1 sodium/bile acid cotransporter 7 [Pseudomonas sp. SJZ085]TWC46743.1 sodium/bile acid cotransporter 7 [Pseudomonas sp. SJZ124]